MNDTSRGSPRISWSALAVVIAACAGLTCVGYAQNAKPVAASADATSRPMTAASVAPSAAVSSPATAPASLPVKLVADAKVRRQLLATFTAFRSNGANTPGYASIPPSAVAGIAPRTLHYGYDPATGTYWAVAAFNATKAASQTAAFVGFQDGGNEAVFRRLHDGSWRVRYVGPCIAGLPAGVAAALGPTFGYQTLRLLEDLDYSGFHRLQLPEHSGSLLSVSDRTTGDGKRRSAKWPNMRW